MQFSNEQGIDQPTFLEELPAEIKGFRTIKVRFWEGLRIANGTRDIFAVDGRGKKYYAEKKEVEKAIAIVREAKILNEQFGISEHEYVEKMTEVTLS